MVAIDRHERVRSEPTRLAYRVRTLGRVSRNGRHSTRGTFHDDAMLTVIREGRGRYVHPSGESEVGPGWVGLVMPGAGAGVLMADRHEPYDHVYCRFAGREALRTAERIARSRGSAFAEDPRWRAVWAVLTRGVAVGWSGNERGTGLAPRDGLIVEALALLEGGDAAESWAGAATVWTAEGLRTDLRDRVSEPIDLDTLAQALGVSRSTLTRRCRALLGSSVREAWEAAKLDLARVLLERTALRVGEIAERVGVEPFYFSRRFRARHGVSPSAWRRRERGGE